METESEIEHFILTELNSTGQTSLAVDEDLLDSGIVDSLGLVQLVGFIEEKFGDYNPSKPCGRPDIWLA